MLNILMIANSAAGGGAERVILDLLRANNEIRKCNMYLSLSEEHGPLLPDFAREVKILKLSLSSNISKVFEIGRNLKRICEAHDIHAIICHTSPVSKAILRTAYFFRLPPIFPIEHTEINRQIRHTSSSWKNKTRIISTRFYYKKAKKIFADSSMIKQELIDLAIGERDAISVIHCPIDTSRLTIKSCKNDYKKFKIVLAGRLEEVKNFKLIIDAFEQIEKYDLLKDQNINVSVSIYGDGPKKQSLGRRVLEKKIKTPIKIYPYTHNLLDEIYQSDLLVSTSKFEGLGNVMLEAIACGVPVIATKTGGSLEIQKHVDGIALSASDRPEDLAKIISDQIINRFLKVSAKDQQFIRSISPTATLPKYLTEIQKSL